MYSQDKYGNVFCVWGVSGELAGSCRSNLGCCPVFKLSCGLRGEAATRPLKLVCPERGAPIADHGPLTGGLLAAPAEAGFPSDREGGGGTTGTGRHGRALPFATLRALVRGGGGVMGRPSGL